MKREQGKLRLLTFLGSLIVIGKFDSFFDWSFPGEGACGWIYTTRLVWGVWVSQLRISFLGWKHNRAHLVPSLGDVNGVSACAVTV